MVKKKEPCLNILTSACVEQMADCCGIAELGGFYSRQEAMRGETHYDYTLQKYVVVKPHVPATVTDVKNHLTQNGQKLILATTIPSQRDVAQALKAVGFKKIATTPSREDPKRTISLWLWKDKGEKKHGRKETKV